MAARWDIRLRWRHAWGDRGLGWCRQGEGFCFEKKLERKKPR